jgi:hypothetical protein
MQSVKEILERNTSKKAEIFVIIDSCDSDAFPMSYEIHKYGQTYTVKNSLHGNKRMICICQAEKQAFMSANGSKFTREVIKVLRNKNPSLVNFVLEINQNLKNSESCKIYVNIFSEDQVWPWVYSERVCIKDKFVIVSQN